METFWGSFDFKIQRNRTACNIYFSLIIFFFNFKILLLFSHHSPGVHVVSAVLNHITPHNLYNNTVLLLFSSQSRNFVLIP